ncbi:MAG: hypothetical protein IJS14_09620 [Lentisphaeria bacterium]|nr:hypothetical protein [Lentisphaeria bacterium]
MIYRGTALDGKAIGLEVENGRIVRRTEITPEPGLPRLLPALVDLQHNGALSHAYNNLNGEGEKELEIIAGHLLRHGIGRVQATFTTADYRILETGAKSICAVLDSNRKLNTLFCGIFHEGVFISPEYGWRGGHRPEFILKPEWEQFSRLNEMSGGRVRMVNLAPEVEGALDFIPKAVDAGIRVSLGHCNPDSATIHKAADLGASMVTHFGNGAAPEIHRFANPFWGFLDDTRLNLGLVGDGFHLPPEVVRTALRCKGTEHCFMVSDANIYSGCPPGLYHRIGGQDCVVEPNGFFHVAGEEILAGAWFQQDRCVEFLTQKCGLDFETAWKLCSVYPAALAGIALPDLTEGGEATFVVHDGQKIQKTVFRGEEWTPA